MLRYFDAICVLQCFNVLQCFALCVAVFQYVVYVAVFDAICVLQCFNVVHIETAH